MKRELRNVERAARRKRDALHDYRAAVVAARTAGASHAAIAAAAGVTRQRVGEILTRWTTPEGGD